MKKFQLGFTLIELLVVITIIAVLAGVGMVSFASAGRSARDARRQADIQTIRQALVMYRSEFGCYPDAASMDGALTLLDAEGYISEPWPEDPKNTGIYVYQYAPATSVICGDGVTTGYESFEISVPLENNDPLDPPYSAVSP